MWAPGPISTGKRRSRRRRRLTGPPAPGSCAGSRSASRTSSTPPICRPATARSSTTSNRPAADAVCVSQSRAAGAIVLGKTVSTEFAFRRAGKTSNPHDRRYSPGGSSSGSAAAVADKMVPLAIGTQTGGSVIRPASYCGIYALKPTFNLFSFEGVRHLAESFDTLGCMANSLEDIALTRAALLAVAPRPLAADTAAPRIALCRTAFWDEVQPAMQAMIEEAGRRLGQAGADVADLSLGFDEKAIL